MTLNRTLLLQDIFDFIKLFGYHWQPTWQPTWLDKNEIAKAYFSKFYVFISDNDVMGSTFLSLCLELKDFFNDQLFLLFLKSRDLTC